MAYQQIYGVDHQENGLKAMESPALQRRGFPVPIPNQMLLQLYIQLGDQQRYQGILESDPH